MLKRLKINQKKLSRKEKNSNNWLKNKRKVALLHEKIVNQRDDFLHKLSRFYINNYDMMAVEDLNIQKMVKNRIFSQNIIDVSWRKFINNLSYKAESAGKTLLRIDPRNTSKVYKYGTDIDRDYNAALNILEKGLKELVGMGRTEFTPVDIRPIRELIRIPASQVVESGNLFKIH